MRILHVLGLIVMQYVVVAVPYNLPEQVQVFGVFNSAARADEIARLLHDPFSATFLDPEEYSVYHAEVQRLD